MAVISDRHEAIVQDQVCLAHVRIMASNLLLSEIFQCIQRLESLESTFRVESLEGTSAFAASWVVPSIFSSHSMVRALLLNTRFITIGHIIDALHRFVGLHVQKMDDINFVLTKKNLRPTARLIVSLCRQASSFKFAVMECDRAANLQLKISEVVQTVIGANLPFNSAHAHTEHVAGHLGRFWNRENTINASNHSHLPHDVGVTLSIMRHEISSLRTIRRQLRKIVDRDYAPSWDLQLHLVPYIGLAAVTVATADLLCVHSRFLGGTGLLEQNMSHYSVVLNTFVDQNIFTPMTQFYENVFSVDAASSGGDSIITSRSSLRDMLIDFTEQNLSHVPGALDLAHNGSMKAVMDVVVEQARSPLRNSIAGSLGHALLLQVQKLKCDVDELMMKSKQLLRAQELNLALVALVPSVLTGACVMYVMSTALFRWRTRDTDVIVSGAQTARFALGDVHHALTLMEDNDDTRNELRGVQLRGWLHAKVFELKQIAETGLIRTAPKVRMRFLNDLKFLVDDCMTHGIRRRHVRCMFQCYGFIRDA